MPLTEKGKKILSSMESTYKSKAKAEEVMYASKNAGKITGIDEEMPDMEENSGMTAMDRLPTRDQFRKQFRDAVREGLPLSKCLDLGTVWNGLSMPGGTKDAFRKTFRDAMSKGASISDALKLATSQK